MTEYATSRIRQGARLVTGLAAVALFVSLFATWSRLTVHQLAFLAVAASGSLGGLSVGGNAWTTSLAVAVALSALAGIVIAAVVLDRPRLLALAAVAALAAAVVAIGALADPPSVTRHLAGVIPAGLPSGRLLSGSGGAGETIAVVASIVSLVGLVALMAGDVGALRRRR